MALSRLRRLCSQLLRPYSCSGEVDQDAEFRRYCEEGKARALALPNRGPIRFGPDGLLAQDILDAYWEHGFYVFEDLIPMEEIQEIRSEFDEILENAPLVRKGTTDKHGRPIRFPKMYQMVKPLGDNVGGSTVGIYNWRGGETLPRHHIKMREPTPPPGAPEVVMGNLGSPLQHMDSALRLYGHPKILAIAESLNGPDFCPFTETFFHKPAYLGSATAWHQDPSCAWDEEWKTWTGPQLGTCGCNFHLAIGNCTPENGLWIVHKSHKQGRIDQKSLLEPGAIDRLKGAVPVLAKPGDLYIQNRLTLHCAFANTSPERRVVFEFGFQRKASVLHAGRTVKNGYARNHAGKEEIIYDEDYIQRRCAMIQVAIDARKQNHPEENSYVYAPFRGMEERYRWNEKLKEDSFSGYLQEPLIL